MRQGAGQSSVGPDRQDGLPALCAQRLVANNAGLGNNTFLFQMPFPQFLSPGAGPLPWAGAWSSSLTDSREQEPPRRGPTDQMGICCKWLGGPPLPSLCPWLWLNLGRPRSETSARLGWRAWVRCLQGAPQLGALGRLEPASRTGARLRAGMGSRRRATGGRTGCGCPRRQSSGRALESSAGVLEVGIRGADRMCPQKRGFGFSSLRAE